MAPVPKGRKSTTETPHDTPPPPSLIDQFSIALTNKPFKDSTYRKNVNRRNRILKQIVAGERIRARQAAQLSIDQNPHSTAVVEVETSQPTANQTKKLKAAEASAGPVGPGSESDYLAYMAIEAPPSVLPPKKYCDITGLEAPYVDPKSRLRYHNTEIYELLKTFGPGTDQTYLALRGAHALLR